ncbi:ABC transporter ATP-binding protein [Candidatus Liberibacter africanus]|uniref:Lipoprotein-releasing system ATP-binding protein lolD n=1 Tax=Candidatus Liberibacter africanus PTSAPSY TaxID=1277257 RepID=A0A0G3I1L9_LIBAF|nr:ABC transporter ATP-binding protein [Candidatus Liberibacter africanus]AKK19771.1 lipoprotein-releasing system ATP-binding protein lolD [Candidatus Liberibacter africanus PTSAPSY]QTP63644.1 ABC transporter ATP-binding protein [Candidatus Liberibacter africanus]
MSGKEVLLLQNIKHSYNHIGESFPVLDNVCLSLKKGEIVALVSPSGTGKSTILHIAGLLEAPDQGDVIIDNQVCNKLSDNKKAFLRCSKIGFVYQAHRLLTDFSVVENIIFPQIIAGINYTVAHQRAMDLLSYMGIAQYACCRSSNISGGEQQRVAICRAIANNPSIILADEPTGNLDPKTAQQVFSVLKDLVVRFGLSALIATHNHDLACQMDRQITIKEGMIVDHK